MKKILPILLLCFCFSATAQTIEDFSAEIPVTDNLMSVVFPAGTLSDYVSGSVQAYVDGSPVSAASVISADGSAGVAVIGSDALCGCDLSDGGETVEFAVLMNGNVIVITDVNPPVVYAANSFQMLDAATLVFTIDGAAVVFGCNDASYLEFDASANLDDASCTVLVVEGCTQGAANNFDAAANTDDGSCVAIDCENYNCCGVYNNFLEAFCPSDQAVDCSYNCAEVVIGGCMNPTACNYSEEPIVEDGSCTYPSANNIDCNGVCLQDTDEDGVCDEDEVSGCNNADACNYYDLATENDLSCEYAADYYNCDGSCLSDYDGDFVCDENEIDAACGDSEACNYLDLDTTTDIDNDLCEYPSATNLDCDGVCLNDINTNGICDEDEVLGCTYDIYINYNPLANVDDGSCFAEYIYGCTDENAFNFNVLANSDDGSCLYDFDYCDCCEDPINYDPNDQICDDFCSVAEPCNYGCPDYNAINFNPLAVADDGSCIYPCSDPNYLEYYLNLPELCTTPITNGGFTAEMFVAPLNTGANMTIPIPVGLVQQFEGGQIAAFSNGICVGLETISSGFIAMGLWGDDSSTEAIIDGMLSGEVPSFVVLYNGGVISLDQNEMTGYTTNGIATISNFQITEPIGCTSFTACNYVTYAIIDDGSCTYAVEYYDCEGTCILDSDGDGICNELEIPGCTLWGYTTFNELATDNDGSCTVSWEEDYGNLTESTTALVDSLENDCANNITIANATLDSLQNTYNVLSGLSISIDLINGWNIIGYTSTYEQDAEIALAEIEDIILIFKDNNADVYMPEYGFNGIGNLIPGQGYQIKVSEEYVNFTFENELILGCTDALACNYNELANLEDTNCSYETETTDCEGNPIALNYAIGDLAEGGIVFYIDETGEHGLVAAMEDITEGSNMGNWGTPEGFEWGCYNSTVSGADGVAIGTGYQNTLDIVSQNCQTENGGITAAQATLNYETEGFTDWFLPSLYELEEMYNTIGNGGSEGNIGGFETSDYPFCWSSSESSSYHAWVVNFNSGYTNASYKYNSLRVRAVRAF